MCIRKERNHSVWAVQPYYYLFEMDKRIIIIGAGPSGIAAATRLIENGFTNLTILEAEPRIGGRVYTVPFGAWFVEVGAQYCHGIRNNAVYNLACEHGLLSEITFSNKNNKFPVYETNGTMISIEKTQKLFQLATRILRRDGSIAYKGSLGNYFMEKYWETLSDSMYDDIDEQLRYRFPKLYQRFQNGNDGSDTWYLSSSVSYVNYKDEPGPGENRYWNTTSRGYATVLDLLQKKIAGQGDPIEITAYTQLNKEVKKIAYNLNDSSTPIHIECTDGSVCDAEHLICTVSLGVLKECHLSLFDPILPQQKIESIESLAFGVIDKIILEFVRPFWPDDWAGCIIVWNPEQLKLIREKDESRWLEGVIAFHRIDYQPNVLIAWIQGASARQMEGVSMDAIVKQCMMLLKMFLKDFDIPDGPTNALRSQWYTNPHFRGSYSSISVETDAMNASNVDLAEPLLLNASQRPVIQFAGEATNDRHIASVHGAIESGWREADRLMQFYNEPKS